MNNRKRVYVCSKCIHYVQHYMYRNGAYTWVFAGHCIRPRLKMRRPDAKTCRYFEERMDTTWKWGP